MKKKNKKLQIKVRNKYDEKFKREIKLFTVTSTITLFPFLVIIICDILEGCDICDVFNTIISFFKRSDMFLAIISITSTSALLKAFSGKYKLYFGTVICWISIIISAIYFCSFNEERISWSRVLGLFILAFSSSLLNIYEQSKIK